MLKSCGQPCGGCRDRKWLYQGTRNIESPYFLFFFSSSSYRYGSHINAGRCPNTLLSHDSALDFSPGDSCTDTLVLYSLESQGIANIHIPPSDISSPSLCRLLLDPTFLSFPPFHLPHNPLSHHRMDILDNLQDTPDVTTHTHLSLLSPFARLLLRTLKFLIPIFFSWLSYFTFYLCRQSLRQLAYSLPFNLGGRPPDPPPPPKTLSFQAFAQFFSSRILSKLALTPGGYLRLYLSLLRLNIKLMVLLYPWLVMYFPSLYPSSLLSSLLAFSSSAGSDSALRLTLSLMSLPGISVLLPSPPVVQKIVERGDRRPWRLYFWR